MQALNCVLEGAQEFSSGKGHCYEENVNLNWKFAKGTTAKAQGTTTITVGYFEAWSSLGAGSFLFSFLAQGRQLTNSARIDRPCTLN